MFRLIQSQSGGSAQPFDLSDRGLMLADGVFTTARVVRGRMILREAHLTRLKGDAAVLDIPVTEDALSALANEAMPAGASGALRLTVTRGPGARGLSGDGGGMPTLIARFIPLEMTYPAAPVRLMTSPIRRNPTSPSARHKTLSYTDNIMALRGAMTAGFDDAVLLSPAGHVACTSAANIFARFGDRLVTPPVEDGALPGILRAWLLAQAGAAGFAAEEGRLTQADLEKAGGLFLTNSLRIYQLVSRFGEVPFEPNLPPGLLALASDLVGERRDD